MLTTYISQLESYGTDFIDALSQELADVSIDWKEPYKEYASAGLKVATLLTPDGKQNNFSYSDCRNPIVTPLLQSMPKLKKYIKDTQFHIMASRLLRLDPGTFLYEHRDYVYLDDVARYRLHVPLVTNENAFLTLPGLNVHLKRGFLWKLNPKETIHSACNFGVQPRIHLMMDCYGNDTLSRLVANEFLHEDVKNPLPPLTFIQRKQLIVDARQILATGNMKTAEELLLRTFCQFDLQETTTYDLLLELFQGHPNSEERIHYWTERLIEVYPERKSDGRTSCQLSGAPV